jgi:hypothetical protein
LQIYKLLFIYHTKQNVKLIIVRQYHQRYQVQRRPFMHGPRYKQGFQNLRSGALPTETIPRLRGAFANRVNGEPKQFAGFSGVQVNAIRASIKVGNFRRS